MKLIKSLSEGWSSSDGKTVGFRIDAADGSTHDFEIPAAELGDFLQYVVWLAEDASKKRTRGQGRAMIFNDDIETAPLPFTQFGFTHHPEPDKAVVVFRNYDFDIGFVFDVERLEHLSESAYRTAAMLRAKSS